MLEHAQSYNLQGAVAYLAVIIPLSAIALILPNFTHAFPAGSLTLTQAAFGLQNMINNFVSGLILLFERPTKVGDVVDLGGNVGEASCIGIPASVIRTGAPLACVLVCHLVR